MTEMEKIQPEDAAEPTSWLGRLNDGLERIKPGALWGAAGLSWVGLNIAASGPEWWMLVVAIWAAPKLWIELSGSGPLFEPEDLEGGATLPPRVRVTAGILALPFLFLTMVSVVSWGSGGFGLLSLLCIALTVVAATGGGYIWAFSERPGADVDPAPSELDDDARAVLRFLDRFWLGAGLLLGLGMLLGSLYAMVKIILEPEIYPVAALLITFALLACVGGYLVYLAAAGGKKVRVPAHLPPAAAPAALEAGDAPYADFPEDARERVPAPRDA